MAAAEVEKPGSVWTSSPRRWYLWASAISVGGLGIRVGYVLISKRRSGVPFNDAFYFHYQANLLVEGKGWFIDPGSYLYLHHRIAQAADHPPLWTLVLAAAAFVGLKSYLSQLLWACVVGTGTVFVTGMAARRVGGPAAGLVAAAIAAVYPNYWLNDGLGLSETLVLLVVAAVVLWSFRFWSEPSWRGAATLGVLCALGALTRSELVLLIVFVLIPIGLVLRGVGVRRRLGLTAVGIFAALLTLAPWVGFNLSRFNRPEFISTELGATLLCANNAFTYQGRLFGYWDGACTSHVRVSGDESDRDAQYRHLAFKYIKAHEDRVPLVVAARVGRELGLFNPWEQIQFDHTLEYRPLVPAQIGLFVYYGLVVMSIAGALVLRRRRITLVPFVGLLVEVVVASMLTYGTTRFRTPLEVALVVLSAVLATDLYSSARARGVQSGSRTRPVAVHEGAV
jgi:4-amino-4-deoxy-L-arabinose transferase-like glycosyltransferase